MTVDNLIMENNNNRENTNLNEWKIKMKKYLFPIALLCSSTCLAFPAYNTVSCSGNVNVGRLNLANSHSHFLDLEYFSKTHSYHGIQKKYIDPFPGNFYKLKQGFLDALV